ncbi:alpha-2-macroglobulin family protein [Hymenobacter sp. BT491]|uniref:alpha-2-macroglobulin family protein n=1 Tax=Hymenobacter sp. BT491 TaxID=2766779 RepID=UPI001653550F|nr:alpha-2-macroglobulin family protein [Hymenobacter sp. BT491]MBC6990684.1 hypothetical protein [Hymenobacter sp. BT491]
MRSLPLFLLLCVLVFTVGSSAPVPPGANAKKWKQIDAFLKKNQTASAGKLVEEIYQQARRQQQTPEYLRALLYKLRLLEAKEEDSDEKAIDLIHNDLQTAQFPARPILHSLLAQLYATYYDQHRGQLYDRTPGATGPATDTTATSGLATWDAARLGAAVVEHYHASLSDEPQRQQQLLLKDLGDAIRGGDAEGRQLRPTLYDLLAHRAIDGLQNDEFYITRPAEQFRLTNPALLAPAAEFARLPLEFPKADSLNGQFHALRALQQLTAFRLKDAQNLPALADVDLKRLRLVQEHAEFANKDSLFRQALARAADTYKALPISTEFLFAEADNLEESSPAQALILCREAVRRFPKSRGAQQSEALRKRIEAVELRFATDEVVLPNQPWLLRLEQRNVKRLYAKAYRISTAQTINTFNQSGDNQEFAKRYARALAAKPVAAWSLEVPGSQDYKSHSVQQAGPALPLGHYLIVISTAEENPVKARAGATTVCNQLQVSALSQVKRGSADSEGPEVLVLHRQSGAPLAGAHVLPFYEYYDQKSREYKPRRGTAVTTNAEGVAQIPVGVKTGENTQLRAVLLTQGADSLFETGYSYYRPRRLEVQDDQAQRRTFLYTDRAIYRPGQTLYFKGILTESRAGKSQLLTQRAVSLRFVDVNGQVVQTLPFTTNDFGSFHGSLVLPTSLLNGEMSLQTDDGSVSFTVEDYKRPTFQVAFEPVKGAPQLGKSVTMQGKATAYAGQPIDGATVRYRVVRRTVWPFFRPYGDALIRFPEPDERQDVEITNGTAQTDSAGGFRVTFTALADEEAQKQRGWRPGYVFEVTADVTDAAGETRTGQQSVSLGTSALTLRLEVPELLNRAQVPALSLITQNAAGEAVPAQGKLRLYRLAPPARGLRPRLWEKTDVEALTRESFVQKFPHDAYADEADESKWSRTLVLEQGFDTEKSPLLLALPAPLAQQAPGRYVLEATAEDAAKQPTKAERYFTLYDPAAKELPVPTPDWFVTVQDSVRPGQTAQFLVGSSELGARILVEAEAKGQTIMHQWLTLAAGEQRLVAVPVPATLGETQLYFHATQVRDNRLYTHTATVQIATPPAPLRLNIATFRDRLQPGEKETWRVTIQNADGKPAAAELLATLYDQSLDVFRVHAFENLNFMKPYFPSLLAWNGRFETEESNELFGEGASTDENEILYPHLSWWGYSLGDDESSSDYKLLPPPHNGAMKFTTVRFRPPIVKRDEEVRSTAGGVAASNVAPQMAMRRMAPPPPPNAPPAPDSSDEIPDQEELKDKSRPVDLSLIQARKNFQETAFWQPDLRTNDKGEIVLEFQMPEAVTRWQLLALAHDQQLHSGLLRRELVTQKQLQVTPNAPRFFREGDQLTLTAKLSNLTAKALSGNAQLFLFDACTQQPIEAKLLQGKVRQKFRLKANQSLALGWNLQVPEGQEIPLEAVTYRVVAQAGEFSDGEENTLPVLPNRLLVTESLPLSVRGAGAKDFELKKLTSTTSATRRNYSLTLEMTQNPAWYAVQALPYLMEYPYECSEQTFSRLYANLLAARILTQNPRIRPVLEAWKRAAASGDKNALRSKLEQNQELKNLLLQETPWVRDGQTDTDRMRRLGELFDENHLRTETAKALTKLAQLQQPNGAFPWFEKMPDDRYITQLIVAGFGKLQRLGAFDAAQDERARPILTKALHYLDAQLQKDYAELRRQKGIDLKQNHLGDIHIQALYARSFWSKQPVAKADQPAFEYYRQQAATFWPTQNRCLQGFIALTLHRASAQSSVSQNIMKALAENALHNDELGMYWKEVRSGYYWREAPTETQATLIEAFDEVANDQKSVDEMKLWLLRQKQTQNWESTRATADACYALLLRGSDWLQPAQPLEVAVGGAVVKPNATEAGTGYFKTTFPAEQIKPTQGRVSIRKPDAGVAWGALYWQYFEQLDKITPAATPLQVERQLFREQRTAGGPVLERLTATTPLRVGDALVVRLILRTDRDLEYVHLKDQRAAGLEPISQTSGYRYQGGLGYYESPRDAATNFFMGQLPKGTHVFEYRLRAAQSGNFSGGLSQIQCLYAPEFTSHSAGERLRIEPEKAR